MEPTDTAPAARSQFITFVGWCGIGLPIVFALFFAGELAGLAAAPAVIQQMLAGGGKIAAQPIDISLQYVIDHLALVALAGTLFLAFALTASVLLLKRIDLGRVSFIILMVLSMGWSVASVFVQQWRMDLQERTMVATAEHGGAPYVPPFIHVFNSIGLVLAILGSLVALVLFAWIIKRLCSPQIRAEFL